MGSRRVASTTANTGLMRLQRLPEPVPRPWRLATLPRSGRHCLWSEDVRVGDATVASPTRTSPDHTTPCVRPISQITTTSCCCDKAVVTWVGSDLSGQHHHVLMAEIRLLTFDSALLRTAPKPSIYVSRAVRRWIRSPSGQRGGSSGASPWDRGE